MVYIRLVGRCPAMPKVTVGTAVASRPPYRSRRALLTHRAPPSGSGVEAVTRQRVYRSDWRKEAGDALDEPLPAEACRLAAPLERCEPEPLHLVEEPPQARVVARDSEVVQMPFQHLFHPSPGFGRVAAKADQPGFVRVQRQFELAHSLLEIVKERLCLVLMLKADHGVVRIADDDHVA